MSQQQKQLSKQKLIQDKALSYNTTGVVLSALECYANRFQKDETKRTNIFSAYNNFDCGSTKTDEQLKQQIICQLTIMHFSHVLFVREHGKYEFPKKLSQEQMIAYIKMWASWVNEEDQKYYASAVAVIEGKDPESFVSELEGDEGKINPNWFISNVGVIYEANQVGNDAVKEYNEKGIEPDMELNSEKVGNEKINMTAGSDYKRRSDQELMDKIFELVIERIEGKEEKKEEKEITEDKDAKKDEQEPQEQTKEDEKTEKEKSEKEQPKEEEQEQPKQESEAKEEENTKKEDKHEPETKPQEEEKNKEEEIPIQNEDKQANQNEPEKDVKQEQPEEYHHCHECCSHDNSNPLPEDPQKLLQELKHRNEHTLSEFKQKSSLQELLQSFGSELHVYKSKYTFYRYKDNLTLHTENYTKLSTYLKSHPIENSNTLIEELNNDTSSQQ